MGNPKSAKSMILTHETPPSMISGVRATGEEGVRAGIRHILFAVRPEEDAVAMDEHIKSLKPVPSPSLVNGELSEAAKRGQAVFEQAKCADCHPGPLYTNLQPYDVGTGKRREEGMAFDTPTLVEIWRTAPYLHDGRAATIKDVLTAANPDDRHGVTSDLTDEQLNDLAAFVSSL
jgi:cytochrome c peroxidase